MAVILLKETPDI